VHAVYAARTMALGCALAYHDDGMMTAGPSCRQLQSASARKGTTDQACLPLTLYVDTQNGYPLALLPCVQLRADAEEGAVHVPVWAVRLDPHDPHGEQPCSSAAVAWQLLFVWHACLVPCVPPTHCDPTCLPKHAVCLGPACWLYPPPPPPTPPPLDPPQPPTHTHPSTHTHPHTTTTTIHAPAGYLSSACTLAPGSRPTAYISRPANPSCCLRLLPHSPLLLVCLLTPHLHFFMKECTKIIPQFVCFSS
jgi:hypothetical protein